MQHALRNQKIKVDELQSYATKYHELKVGCTVIMYIYASIHLLKYSISKQAIGLANMPDIH